MTTKVNDMKDPLDDPKFRHWGLRPGEDKIREAVRLYEEGWTMKEIGKKFDRSQSNIWVWINKFAKELDDPTMSNRRKRNEAKKERARRQCGIKAPEARAPEAGVTSGSRAGADTCAPGEAELKARIARLERELEDARLMRDFYDEMINIAERDFNIPIRKKGGAKR